MAELTLCMIVRDEAEMLGECLESARRAVDRMVVVDTGSRDGTQDVVREHGAELVEHPWDDDFAAARNAGLEQIRSGYVLILDADERLTGRGARVLRGAVKRGEIDLGLLPLHDAVSADAPVREVLSGRARRGEPRMVPRLLRRTPELRYEGIVHESVGAWATAAPRRIEALNAPIVHYGAAPELRAARGKDERNRRLLERRCEQEPDDPMPRAYLAAELRRADQWAEALAVAREAWSCWQRAAEQGGVHDPVLPASVLAHLLLHASQPEQALEVAEEALAREEHPNLHLLAGLGCEQSALRRGGGEAAIAAATAHYQRCLDLDGRPFASEVMDGATTWQAALRLGAVRLIAGDPAAARRAFQRALRRRSDLREASLGLVEAALGMGRASDALPMLESLLEQPDPDAWLLSARAAQQVGSTDDARLFVARARSARDERPFVAAHREGALVALERELAQQQAAQPEPEATREFCVFAWPCYEKDEDLAALMGEYGPLLLEHPGVVLCLRHDPEVDGDVSGSELRLEQAFAEHLGQARDLRVVLVDHAIRDAQGVADLALPRDVAIALPHGDERRMRFLERLRARRVSSPAELELALARRS